MKMHLSSPCLSVCDNSRIAEQILMKLDTKICQDIPVVVKTGQMQRTIYVETYEYTHLCLLNIMFMNS